MFGSIKDVRSITLKQRNMKSKIRVGIVGLQAGRSWAAVAHLTAPGQLTEQYEIVGVVNSSMESSRAAAEAC